MFARSTTVLARPESIDSGIAHLRDEVMPELLAMDGCIGMSMLVDRMSGRCIMTSAWQSRDAMVASEPRVRLLREHASELLGARPQVDEWEIAVLHRDHTSRPGACVRATWVRMTPSEADRAVDVYRMGLLPTMEGYEGFCSASLLIDRSSGLGVSSVTYDSFEAMERSREQADALRESGARDAGVEIIEVCEFELAIAHLRVPEMA
ncbi:antibiotic biosynthesis monooxygenase [Pseudonocardia sp. C8]|uniref:antibiotic biosynthesis monooxygenase n=1 Tax=Pseudonocardia sp. C8 TaxID=2762759 RepID=UPI0016426784|nr:antibiotic biosynthesis monooxygenase [Pseudonocardia sp. C8]MBC3190617.1 antibiotic biosynthesis monooxygenase [Pseudonocardia sp. C8]